jgi:hypothetical protein
MRRRIALLVRGLAVVLFLLQSIGVLLIGWVFSLLIDTSGFDGPPTPERTRLLLALEALAALVALIGAAVEASGLLDHVRVVLRLAVIVSALAVNVFGLIEGLRWSVGVVAFSCAVGSAALVLLASRALGARPRVALLVHA